MTISTAHSLACAAVLGLAAQTDTDAVELRADPTPETAWTTRLELTESAVGAELAVWMNGGEVPSAFLPPLEFDARLELVREYTDGEFAHEAGELVGFTRRVAESQRTGSVESDYGDEAAVDSGDVASALEGAALRYVADADGFAPADDDDPGPELRAEEGPGWAWLAPADAELEIGSEWELPDDLLVRLRELGGPLDGELGLDDSDWMEQRPARGEDDPDAEGAWDAEWSATLAEVREVDGRPTARVALAGEGRFTLQRPGDLSRVPVADGRATDTSHTDHVLEGTLEWDLEAGQPRGIELESRYETVVETVRDPDQEGPEYRSELRFEGAWSVSVQRAPAD